MTGSRSFHPDVKRLLDGELTLPELAPELRPEAERMLALLAAVDRATPEATPWFEQRVMAAVRRRPRPSRLGWWAWLSESRTFRLRPRLALGGALLGVAALLLSLGGDRLGVTPSATAASPAQTWVRFVLYAPNARQVTLAGSFNGWDTTRTPLAPAGATGLWTVTVAVPSGQHQYGFLLDGREWLADPSAPTVDDGFGRRNSVLTIGPEETIAS